MSTETGAQQLQRRSLAEDDTAGGPFAAAWNRDRAYLLNVAYRLVGSVTEAEDVVQEAFLRLFRSDISSIADVRGWLVVVATRVALDHLRSARTRRETATSPWFPEPLVTAAGAGLDPADMITLDESVRMALLIVLERLTPAERAVFVLHDVFQFSFDEIAPIVERTPAACRQLASRARRRISATPPAAHDEVDAAELRRVAEKFIAACAGGDVHPLLEVLDPAVVGWADLGGRATLRQPSRGRDEVASRILRLFGRQSGATMVVADVNGETGVVVAVNHRPRAVLALMVRDARIAAIYAVADPAKLSHVHVPL